MERLLSASLWGTALALAVALLCRLFPKLPAALRFWLWWAVPAKLLLGLVVPVSLAVLPASRDVVAFSQGVVPLSKHVVSHSKSVVLPSQSVVPLFKSIVPLSKHVVSRSPSVVVPSACIFLLFWLVGAGITLVRAVSGPAKVYAALRAYSSAGRCNPQAGRSRPDVREVPGVGPLVLGLVRPVIVLPTGLSDSEKRLALAHEEAHLARRDPWLALVPLAARVIFWFLPTGYLVEKALATAREEACDALARQSTGASAREYGALLLKLTQPASEISGTLAMASPVFSQLQSRLQTLTVPQKRLAAWPLLLPGALLLPGWRLTERAGVPRKASSLPLSYERLNLPTLGGRYSDAFAITDSGEVVGAANGRDGLGHAALWQDGVVRVLDKGRSIAFAASQTGEVAFSNLKDGWHQAQWLRGATRQSLPGLPDFPETAAVGMTENGVLVGSAQGRRGTRAVVWEDGQVRELGTLGGPFSQAAAVNAKGWIVGKADLSPTETHAFLYDGTKLRDLGTLGGRHSRATAINAKGQVVGMSETGAGERQAFVWSERIGMRPLPGTDAIALALTDDGTVVGQAEGHAALWSPEGTRIPLDPSLLVARGINTRGEIVGQGKVGDDLRGFVLKPLSSAAATSAPPTP